jgi:hypothetical protein
MLLELAE